MGDTPLAIGMIGARETEDAPISRWIASQMNSNFWPPNGLIVVNPLQQHRILETGADGPDVVVDTVGPLIGGQIGFAHDKAPCTNFGVNA
jgi:hypothetical protein